MNIFKKQDGVILNWGAKFTSDIFRLIFNTLYFITLARHLGPALFGDFSVLIATTRFAIPFVTLGIPMVMAIDVVKSTDTYKKYLGTILLLVTGLSFLITIGFWIASPLISSLQKTDMLSFGIVLVLVELFVEGVRITLVSLFQAVKKLYIASLFDLLQIVLRFCALLLLLSVQQEIITLIRWIAFYIIADLLFLTCFLTYTRYYGFNNWEVRLGIIKKSFPMGLSFSLGAFSRLLYTDLDKLLVSNMIGSIAAGVYIAGYKVVSITFMPVASYLSSIYPYLLHEGNQGKVSLYRRIKRYSPATVALGASVSIFLWVFGPTVTQIALGSDYIESSEAVRLLAPIVFLQSIHFFAGDLLTSEMLQPLRTAIQLGIWVINMILSIWWINVWGWKGAAYATIASELLLTICMLLGLLVHIKRVKF